MFIYMNSDLHQESVLVQDRFGDRISLELKGPHSYLDFEAETSLVYHNSKDGTKLEIDLGFSDEQMALISSEM